MSHGERGGTRGSTSAIVRQIDRICFRILFACLPMSLWARLMRRRFRAFIASLEDDLTDAFLELLLHGMSLGFWLIPAYGSNIQGFRGTVVFRTKGGQVGASVHFRDGKMHVEDTPTADGNATVVFQDGAALRAFLFSKDQDILHSLMANSVEVHGNLNYVYRFGFLANDLLYRIGIQNA